MGGRWLAVLVSTACAALCAAPSGAAGAVQPNGWGFGIADNQANWSDLDSHPELGDAFRRLRPKTFRLIVDWSAAYRPHHLVRAHKKIDRARSLGVEHVTVTFGKPNDADVNPAWGYAPDPSVYRAEVTKVVQDLWPKVDAWGPANEPNTAWLPADAGGPAKLAGYYQALRDIVNSVDPTATLTSPDFLDRQNLLPITSYVNAYTGAGGGWGDVVAWHPYHGVNQRQIKTTVDFATDLVPAGKSIWVTEVGAHYSDDPALQNARTEWLIGTLAAHPSITRINYYHMLDHNPEWDTGLLNSNVTPRPAWKTWCRATHGGNAADPDCADYPPIDNRASAVPVEDGVNVFALGTDGAIWVRVWRPATGWSAWSSLGGTFTTGPAVTRVADGFSVYARGTDRAIWAKDWRPSTGWSAWYSLGGTFIAGAGAVQVEDGVNVFGVGTDRGMWVRVWRPATGWSAWSSLGGTFTSSPAASPLADGFNVYARGDDGAVWVKVWRPATGWAPWASLGGSFSWAPAAGPVHDGVNVYGTGMDGAIWAKVWRPATGWLPWYSLGGTFISGPGVSEVYRDPTTATDDSVNVFGRGENGAIFQKFWTQATGWSTWSSLGIP